MRTILVSKFLHILWILQCSFTKSWPKLHINYFLSEFSDYMDKQYENLPGDVKDGGGSFLNGDSLSSLIIKNVLPIMCCIIFRAMTQLIRWVSGCSFHFLALRGIIPFCIFLGVACINFTILCLLYQCVVLFYWNLSTIFYNLDLQNAPMAQTWSVSSDRPFGPITILQMECYLPHHACLTHIFHNLHRGRHGLPQGSRHSCRQRPIELGVRGLVGELQRLA